MKRTTSILCGLALTAVMALSFGCREAGSVSASQGSAGNAVTSGHRVSIGEVLFQVIRANLDASTKPGATAQVQVLDARHQTFVTAIDATVSDEVTGNLKTTLDELLDMVVDGTLPAMAEDLASILEFMIHDPADPQDLRLHALIALGETKSSLSRESIMRLVSRMTQYREMDELIAGIARLMRENDGLDATGAPTAAEADLLGRVISVGSDVLADLERPTAGGTSLIDNLKDTLLQPVDLRGAQVGGPAWAVRIDQHGNPAVALASGRVPFPFIDRDGDRTADVNAAGDPVDARGAVIDIPAFGRDGVRDADGLAIGDSGALLYEYFDAKATPLGQVLRLGGDLSRADVPFRLVAALNRTASRTSYINTRGLTYEGFADDNPVTDLLWNGLELFRYSDAPKLLEAFAALIKNDPRKGEELMVKLVEAVDIIQNTPSNPATAHASTSFLDDVQPLLDQSFEVNSSGQAPARMLLRTFTAEQARLQNLPAGFALMIKYSDWAARTPTSPGDASLFERLLGMVAEANQCDSWPFGNMAEFYLDAMAGNKRILGININVSTINLLLDIPALRSLLCNQISDGNVRALAAFAQSGALDAFTPIAKAFSDAGQTTVLKDIMVVLHNRYAADMRPHEAGIVRLLESGAVEKIFEVLDDMNRINVPGTGEIVSDVIADFLAALVDDDRHVEDRKGRVMRSLAHLLFDPIDRISQRIGSDPALDSAMNQAFYIALGTIIDSNGDRVLQHKGLIPLAAAVLEALADDMSLFPWIRNPDITEDQRKIQELMVGPELPLLVDLVLTIERSPSSNQIKASITNLLTPNFQGNHDIYGSVLEILAASLQQSVDSTAVVDLLNFAGRALDPQKGWSRPLAINFTKLLEGQGGPTVTAILRNGLNRGPNGQTQAPLEVVLDIVDEMSAAGSSGPQASTPDTIKDSLQEIVDFIRDDQSGMRRLWANIRSTIRNPNVDIDARPEAPSPSGRDFDRARSLLLGVVNALERRLYTDERMRATYCRRSAQELLAGGHIHFATPCHDFATVALFRLTEAGFAVTPALLPIRRWLRPLKFQVGLELILDGDPYYVGASTTANRLAPGRFVPTRSRPLVHRASAANAPPGSALLRCFGIDDLSVEDDHLQGLLPGYDHEADLRSHRSFASPSAFEKAHARALEKYRSDGGAEILGVGTWRLDARSGL